MVRPNSKLEGLQTLRGFAALLVVADHCILNLVEAAGLSPSFSPWASALGNLGVEVFFAISGFIMLHTTRDDFSKGRTTQFWLRRIWRIVPIYWLATMIYAARLTVGGEAPSPVDLIKSLLFIPYLSSHGDIRPIYPVGWTLNYEMLFYLLFGLALMFRRLVGEALLCGVLLALVGLGLLLSWGHDASPILTFISSPIVLFFLLGVAVRHAADFSAAEVIGRSSWVTGGALLLVNLVLAVAWPGAGTLVVSLLIIGTVLPISVVGIEPTGRAATVSHGIGDASYSIYLSHLFLLGPTTKMWVALRLPVTAWPLYLVIMIPICALAGWAVHRYIERPMLAFIKPFLIRPPRHRTWSRQR